MSNQPRRPTPQWPGAPPVSVRVIANGPVTVITVAGELTYGTTHVLNDVVDRVIRGQASPRIVLDLVNVTFLCSAGIHALLATRERIISADGRLVLYQPSSSVERILRLTGDDRCFDIQR
jgi:anti-anti-sigma factor